MDGLEVCRQLRAVGTTPIVFLTSRAEEIDQLVGFAAGADDYVTKPFSPKVLVARVGSVLRRGTAAEETKTRFEVGPLVVDTESRMATAGGVELDLTRTEFDLLTTLMENPRRVVTATCSSNGSGVRGTATTTLSKCTCRDCEQR